MTDKENCTICFDELFPTANSTITRLVPCAHHYHTDCVKSWKKTADTCPTCPTCRCEFEGAEIINIEHSVISRTAYIKPGFFLRPSPAYINSINDFISVIPQERERYSLVLSDLACMICGSHEGVTNYCDFCSSSVHLWCTGSQSASYWDCPICDEVNDRYNPCDFTLPRGFPLLRSPTPTGEEQTDDQADDQLDSEQHAWEAYQLATARFSERSEAIRRSLGVSGRPQSRNYLRQVSDVYAHTRGLIDQEWSGYNRNDANDYGRYAIETSNIRDDAIQFPFDNRDDYRQTRGILLANGGDDRQANGENDGSSRGVTDVRGWVELAMPVLDAEPIDINTGSSRQFKRPLPRRRRPRETGNEGSTAGLSQTSDSSLHVPSSSNINITRSSGVGTGSSPDSLLNRILSEIRDHRPPNDSNNSSN